MIVFWSIAAVLLAGALAFILVPLMRRRGEAQGITRDAVNVSVYRDQLLELDADLASGVITQQRHGEALRELERRLLDDTTGTAAVTRRASGSWRTAAAVAVGVPAMAIGMYLSVGTPQMLAPDLLAAGGEPHAIDERQIEAMVARLAERLEAAPDDARGWLMLGRSYAALERFKEASAAYAKAVTLVPNDAQLLADYADVLAMAQGQRLQGEPEKLIARALTLDPDNVKALALAGSAAFARKDFAGAVAHWERLARVAPPDSGLAKSVGGSIDEARRHAAGLASPGVAAAPATAPAATAPAARGAGVSGVVELAPGISAQVAPTDTLFVFARPAEGSRMPLAIMRAQAKDLPLKFTLDDSSAMVAGAKLSSQPLVIVGARISRSGSAVVQPGDVQGYSAPVAPGAAGLRILISEVAK